MRVRVQQINSPDNGQEETENKKKGLGQNKFSKATPPMKKGLTTHL